MERTQLERMCDIQQPSSNWFDELWKNCQRDAPAQSALLFGTADGVVNNGLDRLEKHSSTVALEGIGAVGIGVALKAAPKYISVPAAIIGGAGTFTFLQDACNSFNQCKPYLDNTATNPDLARQQVAKKLGPIAFEGASMLALGCVSAALTEQMPIRRSAHISELVTAKEPSVSQLTGDVATADLRRYTRHVFDLREVTSGISLSENLSTISKLPIRRLAFGKSQELHYYPFCSLASDKAKHDFVANTTARYIASLSNDTVTAIPTLTRPYTGIGSPRLPKDHVDVRRYERASKSVVKINGIGNDGEHWSGSGFVVSSDGKIATALHVATDAKKLSVQTNDGITFDARLIAHDFDTDLAVLQLEGYRKGLQPLELADNALTKGHDVFLYGHPAGSNTMFVSPGLYHRRSLRQAYLSIPESRESLYSGRKFDTVSYFIHSRSGNSGGPVVNSDGKVIGVHTSADILDKGYTTEVRVGMGTSVVELTKLLQKIPQSPADSRGLVWKPAMLLEEKPRN